MRGEIPLPTTVEDYFLTEHFGGYEQYLNVPLHIAQQHHLVWLAIQKVNAKSRQQQTDDISKQFDH